MWDNKLDEADRTGKWDNHLEELNPDESDDIVAGSRLYKWDGISGGILAGAQGLGSVPYLPPDSVFNIGNGPDSPKGGIGMLPSAMTSGLLAGHAMPPPSPPMQEVHTGPGLRRSDSSSSSDSTPRRNGRGRVSGVSGGKKDPVPARRTSTQELLQQHLQQQQQQQQQQGPYPLQYSSSTPPHSPSPVASAGGEGESPSAPITLPQVGPKGRTRSIVFQACYPCRNSHLACDLSRPCQRCCQRKIGDQCKDVPRLKKGMRKKLAADYRSSTSSGGESSVTPNRSDSDLDYASLQQFSLQAVPQEVYIAQDYQAAAMENFHQNPLMLHADATPPLLALEGGAGYDESVGVGAGGEVLTLSSSVPMPFNNRWDDHSGGHFMHLTHSDYYGDMIEEPYQPSEDESDIPLPPYPRSPAARTLTDPCDGSDLDVPFSYLDLNASHRTKSTQYF